MHQRALPASLLSSAPTLLQRRLSPFTRRWTKPKKSHRWQLCPRAESEESLEDALEVEEIDREYCNDFVCTSSPSVEETIKTFAVDLQRPGRWTMTRFPGDVIYKATPTLSITLFFSLPRNAGPVPIVPWEGEVRTHELDCRIRGSTKSGLCCWL